MLASRNRLGMVARLLAVRVTNIDNLDALRAAAASAALVVLGLRADFYARCAAEPRLLEPLQNGKLIATPMKTDQLRGVIEQPASKAGFGLEPGLTERILQDLGGDDRDDHADGSSPFLSYALFQTWRRRQGERMTLAGYEATGRMPSSPPPSTPCSPAPTSASSAPRSGHPGRTRSPNASSAPCAANASTTSSSPDLATSRQCCRNTSRTTTPTARTDRFISTRPQATLPHPPARPSDPYDETASAVSSMSTCRSRDVTDFSAPTPGERANAQLKSWKVLRKIRCCPQRATAFVQAIQTLILTG